MELWERIREKLTGRNLYYAIGGAVVFFVVIGLLVHFVIGRRSNLRLGGIKLGANEMVIYTVDSFCDWGLADSTLGGFKTLNQCQVRIEKFPGAGPMIDRLVAERKNPIADVVFGIDPTYLAPVLRNNLLAVYRPAQLSFVDDRYEFDRSGRVTPVDYSYLALVYDSTAVPTPPAYFGEWQSEAWKNKLILPDPRITGQGRSLLLWTYGLYGGEGFAPYWKATKGSINTVAPGFDAAYGSFLAGTAPLVLNYATRPAYHHRVQEVDRYQYIIPREGSFRYIEGVAVVQGARKTALARKFVDFCLTADFQRQIPTTLWTFPVREEIPVPAPFDNISIPAREFTNNLNPATCGNQADDLVRIWRNLM
jgi:thiamine transport system substrate-binding protein